MTSGAVQWRETTSGSLSKPIRQQVLRNVTRFQIFVNTLNVIEEIILVNNSLTEVPSFGKLSRLSNLNLNGNNVSCVYGSV